MLDVQGTFSRFTKGPPQDLTYGLVKAGWVERFVESPITFWCLVHAPEECQDPMNDFQQLLFDHGKQHQRNVAEEAYPGWEQAGFRTEEEGFKKCLEFLVQGAVAVQDMPLICRPLGLEGRPDVLERVDGAPSDLGGYAYRVVEIKSARRIKDSHVLQGALYNRVLGQIQGVEPEEFHLVNRDHEISVLRMSDVTRKLDEVLTEMREVIAGKPVDPCYGAGGWPWASYVNQMAIDSNDVSLITGVGGAKRASLVSAGIDSVDDLAYADPVVLTNIKGIGAATARKMITSAQSISRVSPLRRQPTPDLPHAKTEVFFDFEGVESGGEPGDQDSGLEMVNYLIGALRRTPGQPADFETFFAATPNEEDRNLREFLEWANSLDDPVFYHWHHYERTHLRKMVDRYGVDPALAGGVLKRMVDLQPWATKTFAFPCYGEGLKEVARSLGFEWRQNDVTGVGSMALYLRYVESGGQDEDSKRKIIVYNEDDCRATMRVHDWVWAQTT